MGCEAMTANISYDLVTTFPDLYKDLSHIECGDGWHDLLYELSGKIEKLMWELPSVERASCYAAQVKSKLGTLRFYMYGSTDAIEWLIREAEARSACICEQCGKPGKLCGRGWVFTACEEHANKP